MGCMHFISYTILINGVPSWPFTPSSGIRQGDPISPYLYAEGLSSFLRAAEEWGVLIGYQLGRGPTISHLLFANNSLLFSKADP